MTFSQAEFELMLWEMLRQVFTLYAVVFTAAVLFFYLLLLGREASR